MKKEDYAKASFLSFQIDECERNIAIYEKIIKDWEEKHDILSGNYEISIKNENQHKCPLPSVSVSILDNEIGVQCSSLTLPIEAIKVALLFIKDCKEKLEKEFEKI